MRAGLEEALLRYATFAEAADGESPVASVMAAAPDLVVLVGDATRAHQEILGKLKKNPMTSSVPVILLAVPDLEIRLSAARRGVAIVERTASVDEMAKQIAQLARELPEQPQHSGGDVGEATLHELLDIVKRKLEGGILSVEQKDGPESARFVLKPGRNVDAAIRDFVRRIKPLIKAEQPLHYEFDDAGSKIAVLDEILASGADLEGLKERRILLVEDDAAAADALAQELRANGAVVTVSTSVGSGIDRARALDPEIVLVDEAGLDGESYAILRRIRRDLGLRWASLLFIRLRDLLPKDGAPQLQHLSASVKSLLAPDREISERGAEEDAFETRLESLGPSRLLRALCATGKTFHVTIKHPRAVVEVAIAEGLIAGSEAVPMGGAARRVGGVTALATLLALSHGRVSIARRDAPSTANLLMPVSDAFVQASNETPPIKPSLPPPGHSRIPGSDASATALLTELRGLLHRMRESEGISADTLAELHTTESLLPEHRPEFRPSVLAPEPGADFEDEAPTGKLAMPRVPKAPPVPKPRKPGARTMVGMPVAAPPSKPSVPPPPPPAALRSVRSAPPPPPPPAMEKIREATGKVVTGVGVPDSTPPPEPVGALSPAPVPLDPPVIPGMRSLMPGWMERARDTMVAKSSQTPRWALMAGGAVVGVLLVSGLVWALVGGGEFQKGTQLRAETEAPTVVAAAAPVTQPSTAAAAATTTEADSAGETAAAAEAEAEPDTEAEAETETEAEAEAVAETETETETETEAETEAEAEAEAENESAQPESESSAAAVAVRTPRERLLHNIRAANYFRGRGNLRQARTHYIRALRQSPRNGRALAGMTKVALAERRPRDAVRFARRLVATNQSNAGNRVLLGDALRAAGNGSAARQEYERALRINPRHGAARRRLNR